MHKTILHKTNVCTLIYRVFFFYCKNIPLVESDSIRFATSAIGLLPLQRYIIIIIIKFIVDVVVVVIFGADV